MLRCFSHSGVGAVVATCLVSTGCAFENPIGFWDIVELTAAVDGGESGSQIDYGTFEVIEQSSNEVAYAHVRYYPVVTDGVPAFAPQQTPLESSAAWGGSDDEEGFEATRLFGFFTGTLVVDRYRGPEMTLTGEGTWGNTLSGVEEYTPVEVTLELER